VEAAEIVVGDALEREGEDVGNAGNLGKGQEFKNITVLSAFPGDSALTLCRLT
jgi:hypothetical protein